MDEEQGLASPIALVDLEVLEEVYLLVSLQVVLLHLKMMEIQYQQI